MKFAIHRHRTVPDHYDCMFERGETLLTWRILTEHWPQFLEGIEVPAQRIQDHRKEYLTYEGPISCDRGRVELYDTGQYQSIAFDICMQSFELTGAKIIGQIILIHETEDSYRFRFSMNQY